MPMDEELTEELRAGVRFLYDLQRLRLQVEGRPLQEEAGKDVDLDPGQMGYMSGLAARLRGLEDEAVDHVEALSSRHPMNDWLRNVTGVGPRMAGVILSEVRMTDTCRDCDGEVCGKCEDDEPGCPPGVIDKCPTVSSLWKFSGLSVEDGEADRLRKGEKAPYNTFLKTKMVKVLGDSFLKTNSPYREIYDHERSRKRNQQVDPCMQCGGSGEATGEDGDEVECWNCEGSGGPAPWGCSDRHRHRHAIRVMVKEFLKDLWVAWREKAGLETRPTYAEEYLDREHTEKPTDPDTPHGPPIHMES